MSGITLLFALLIAHAVCDYPLQGDWLARAKSHRIEVVPGQIIWPHALAAHAGIHAGAVWLLTGSALLGLLEMIAHAAIDWAKCDGRLSYNQDQLAHALCKVLWVVIFAGGIAP